MYTPNLVRSIEQKWMTIIYYCMIYGFDLHWSGLLLTEHEICLNIFATIIGSDHRKERTETEWKIVYFPKPTNIYSNIVHDEKCVFGQATPQLFIYSTQKNVQTIGDCGFGLNVVSFMALFIYSLNIFGRSVLQLFVLSVDRFASQCYFCCTHAHADKTHHNKSFHIYISNAISPILITWFSTALLIICSISRNEQKNQWIFVVRILNSEREHTHIAQGNCVHHFWINRLVWARLKRKKRVIIKYGLAKMRMWTEKILWFLQANRFCVWLAHNSKLIFNFWMFNDIQANAY